LFTPQISPAYLYIFLVKIQGITWKNRLEVSMRLRKIEGRRRRG